MQAAIALPRIINMQRPDRAGGHGRHWPAQADALRELGHQVQVRRHEGGLTGHPPRRATAGKAAPIRGATASPKENRYFGPEEAADSVLLRAGEDRRVRAGHPWAFSNEILMDAETKAMPPGSLATLRAPGGEALGLVTFNPHSLIAGARCCRPIPRPRSMRCSSAGGWRRRWRCATG